MYDFESHCDRTGTFAIESLWYGQRFGFNRSSATTTACLALEQASDTLKRFRWEEMTMDVRDLARLAILNSVVVNQ